MKIPDNKHTTPAVFGRLIAVALLITLLSGTYPAATAAQDVKDLPRKWRQWINEEVVYIISDHEREVFLQLKDERQRERFEEEFWLMRDPTPGTAKNERKIEHYERLAYVNRFFGRESVKPGWATDRGRYYIILGAPKDRQEYPSNSQVYPFELWTMQADPTKGVSPFFYLLFFQRYGSGEWVLYDPITDGPESLIATPGVTSYQEVTALLYDVLPELAHAAYTFSFDETPTAFSRTSGFDTLKIIKDIDNIKNVGIDSSYADRILLGRPRITTMYAFADAQLDSMINAASTSDGIGFIDYSFIIPPDYLHLQQYDEEIFGALTVEVSVADQDGLILNTESEKVELSYTEEKFNEIKRNPLIFEGRILSPAGDMTISIQIKDDVNKLYYLITKTVNVVSANPELPHVSPVFLYHGAETLPDKEDMVYMPFQYERLKLITYPGNEYAAGSDVFMYGQVVFPRSWYDNPEYQFRLKAGITDLQGNVLTGTDQMIPITVAARAGMFHMATRLPASQLAPGKYKLDILLDFGRGIEPVRQVSDISIVEQRLQHANRYATRRMEFRSAETCFKRARIADNQDQRDVAEALYLRAVNMSPFNNDYRLALGDFLIRIGKPEQVENLILRAMEQEPENVDMNFLLARSYSAQGNYSKALKYLERLRLANVLTVDSLNLLAETCWQLGDREQAIIYWRQSLEIDANQGDISRKLEEAEKNAPGAGQ